jgi:type II secretory pathway pseudopilin PulG
MIGKSLSQYIKHLGKMLHSEDGIALTEALVTLGITSIVAAVFLTSMSTSSKAVLVSQEQVTAENLAKSQMEYAKGQQYDEVNNPPQYTMLPPGDIPENYAISISAERLDPEGDGITDDDGLQKLTVVINYDGAQAFHLEGYRMKR